MKYNTTPTIKAKVIIAGSYNSSFVMGMLSIKNLLKHLTKNIERYANVVYTNILFLILIIIY